MLFCLAQSGILGAFYIYKRFIRSYGNIYKPLTTLLKKNLFEWTNKATVAFQALKEAMITLLVLAMPNFLEKFTVKTDASGVGIKAVLMQKATL